MKKNTLLHFVFLSYSNIKRIVSVNLLFVVPIFLFLFAASQLVPLLIHLIDSLNITVIDHNPEYKNFVLILTNDLNESSDGKSFVYVFRRREFNAVRRYIFLPSLHNVAGEKLREGSLGFNEVLNNGEVVSIRDSFGQEIVRVSIERLKEESIEILFYKEDSLPGINIRSVPLLVVLLILSFVTVSGSLGGISDFTQRIVFHETKKFSYLFKAIKRSFFRSVSVSLFFAIIVSAIAANIYFYIFYMMNDVSVFIAALNFWMLFFFVFLLTWTYPLLVLNRDDSIWKVMKKSLYVAFDNHGFTLNTLLFVAVLFIMSFFTLFLIPGLSGTFGYLNSAVKEISSHYSRKEE